MLWWVAETTLVAAGLAAVAALAPRLRPLGPAARHALWLVVLIRLVTPPVWSWPWPVPVPSVRSPGGATGDWSTAAAAGGVGPAWPGTERVGVEAPRAAAADRPGGDSPVSTRVKLPEADTIGRLLLAGWLVGSVVLAVAQAVRIVRFRRVLRGTVPAPAWIVAEAERVGERLGVGVPDALVVPGLGTPLLWCLGRPRLLLPSRLIGSLDVAGWRAILAHELAHLRRGDPWVRRLALVAGWGWWWNPLYWVARRRLDVEAELACDAWVVWALPDDRLVYAETLLGICASLATGTTRARTLAPALGVGSSGWLFERRLTMILRDRVPCRLSLPGLLGAGLLALLSLPSWTIAQARVDRDGDRPAAANDPDRPAAPKAETDGPEAPVADDDEDRDRDDDRARAAEPARSARAARRAERARTAAKKKAATRPSRGRDDARRSSPAGEAHGPDPELSEQLETLTRKLEKSMEEKFGPGSEFEEKMKQLGKRMEEKFGPGSEFEEKMKQLGERMEKQFGPGSDFEKQMKDAFAKEKGKERPGVAPKTKTKSTTIPTPRAARRESVRTGRSSRAARIREIESKIDQLRDELRKLKEDDSDGEEDDDAAA